MRLREVQLLGVLTIIVGGVIVLSLWSCGPKKENAEAQKQQNPAPEGNVAAAGTAQPAAPAADQAGASLDKILEQPAQHPPVQAQATAPQGQGAGAAQATQADQGAARMHIVQKGDTLGAISAKYLGSSTKWKLILEANRGIITKPEDLRPGMKLTIPSVDTPSAPAAASTGSHRQSPARKTGDH